MPVALVGGLESIIPVFEELYFTTFSNKHNKEISVNSIKEAVVSIKCLMTQLIRSYELKSQQPDILGLTATNHYGSGTRYRERSRILCFRMRPYESCLVSLGPNLCSGASKWHTSASLLHTLMQYTYCVAR